MRQGKHAKLLRIHICESDRHEGKPLYEATVARCRELSIAGATVFRGLEGYGDTAELHRAHLIRHDQPIVDTPEKLERLVPAVEAMMDTALLAVSDVRVVRVEKETEPAEAADG